MAMILVSEEGTVDSPDPFDPQATTTPFVRKASACIPPAAIATTPLAFDGTVVCPAELFPQATTFPFVNNAKLKLVPQAIAIVLPHALLGIAAFVSPHCTRVPSFLRAK